MHHSTLLTAILSPCVQALHMGLLCLALLGLSAALVCPDGGMCEDRNTCCKDTVGRYGCCPLPRVSYPVSHSGDSLTDMQEQPGPVNFTRVREMFS